jgi:hypothetical protein
VARAPKKKTSGGAPDRGRPDAQTPGRTPPSSPPRPVRPRVEWLVAAAFLSALLVSVASFLPALRLWGLNHLAFVPAGARYAALVLLALSFLPVAAGPVYRLKVRMFDAVGVSSNRPLKLALVGMVAVASVAGFWSARSSTLLLGDGQLIVRSFEAAEEGYDRVIMRSAKAIMNEETIAPGSTLLYYGAIKAGSRSNKAPVVSMRALNCILGGILIFLLGTVAAGGFARGELRLWLLALALGSCSLELFFGYIEQYTLPTLLLAVYVMLAFRALHQRGPLWAALIPLVLACYAHIQSILFIPSFVYLLLWTSESRRSALLHYWTASFSALAFIGVICAPLIGKISRFYVPIGFGNAKYALFSPNHLADIANELFMLLPILPVVAVMWWLGRDAERSAGRDARRDPKSLKTPAEWFTHPAEWQLTTTILVPCGLYILFFHPEIGMPRDWDLFTMSTTALVPFVLLVLNRYLRATALPLEATARFAVPSMVVLLVSSAAWVSVNASTDRTIDRFKSILTYDRTHASYAWENLAMLQHDRKQLDAAIETMRIAVQSGNPRQQVRLAVYLDEAGRTDEARQVLMKVLERRPEFGKARFRLLLFLERQGDWAAILPVARDGVKYNPEDGIYHFFYGEALLQAGQVEEGIAMFRECARFKLPKSVTDHIAATFKIYEEQKAGK